jgi:5-formyltetrahydrofolate cyclo-ligase
MGIRYHRPMASDPDAQAAHGSALREAKQALRARVVAARNAIDAWVHAADSTRIADRLAGLPAFAAARTILVTLPFGSEWNVRPLVERALRQGKVVAVPRVDASAKMLVLHAIRDLGRDIAAGFRAIPEPLSSTPVVVPEAVDFVLVPGVAFDAQGRRLGYGGGYYDRLLPLCRRDAFRAAGAFAVQVVETVPTGPHDARVDAIATPDALIAASGKA